MLDGFLGFLALLALSVVHWSRQSMLAERRAAAARDGTAVAIPCHLRLPGSGRHWSLFGGVVLAAGQVWVATRNGSASAWLTGGEVLRVRDSNQRERPHDRSRIVTVRTRRGVVDVAVHPDDAGTLLDALHGRTPAADPRRRRLVPLWPTALVALGALALVGGVAADPGGVPGSVLAWGTTLLVAEGLSGVLLHVGAWRRVSRWREVLATAPVPLRVRPAPVCARQASLGPDNLAFPAVAALVRRRAVDERWSDPEVLARRPVRPLSAPPPVDGDRWWGVRVLRRPGGRAAWCAARRPGRAARYVLAPGPDDTPWAVLFDSHGDRRPTLAVRLAESPMGAIPPAGTCTLHGDPRPPGRVVVRVGTTPLWPSRRARRATTQLVAEIVEPAPRAAEGSGESGRDGPDRTADRLDRIDELPGELPAELPAESSVGLVTEQNGT